MRYRVFGRNTGLKVAELSLGTGNFGTGWGYGAERDEARRLFDVYREAGGNFIDCADAYQAGQAEELVGDFIGAHRDEFVLATKYTFGAEGNAGVSRSGNSRKNMFRSIDASLRRLRTDRIDLYWAHLSDEVTPSEEILRGFEDLIRAGKVLHAGFSNFPAWRVARAATIAEFKGWAAVAGIQVEYSLAERTTERELLPMAEALGLGIAAWSPLGGGFLTGKYRSNTEGRLQALGTLVHTEKTPRETATLDAVLAVAGELGVPAAQVALAWLLHKAVSSTTAIIPVLGPRTRDHLEVALSALQLKLSMEQLERLDSASAVTLGIPHEQIREHAAQLGGGKDGTLLRSAVPVA